jgi:hypothetical protein
LAIPWSREIHPAYRADARRCRTVVTWADVKLDSACSSWDTKVLSSPADQLALPRTGGIHTRLAVADAQAVHERLAG